MMHRRENVKKNEVRGESLPGPIKWKNYQWTPPVVREALYTSDIGDNLSTKCYPLNLGGKHKEKIALPCN
jgi:hypothetical protein